ncbi:dual specificity phosphatase domain protein (macronuclear) [Tetrahymena thermophila SB210]|uniref:protein-tyrosine-phosphatase n=1 Tax=Tetrahymena thermophila (strain SB210) TaxID=312017 RepID=I7M2V5_TETTS|nr:dual specificity phosphatase domain protein [Tetrahymena thermophila SB210]EAS01378.2 dual specificity phosphatase domain protein [Tetrahymena thermophila SB210]|eukprot:XP_001021624.2 dual specificity phosphatase domain protein [Tetrahymena thermophila SB210]
MIKGQAYFTIHIFMLCQITLLFFGGVSSQSSLERLLVDQNVQYNIIDNYILQLDGQSSIKLDILLNNTNVTQVLQFCEQQKIELNIYIENVQIYQNSQGLAFLNNCKNSQVQFLSINQLALKNVTLDISLVLLQNLKSNQAILVYPQVLNLIIQDLKSDSFSIFQSKLPLLEIGNQTQNSVIQLKQFIIPYLEDNKQNISENRKQISESFKELENGYQSEQRSLILISNQNYNYPQLNISNVSVDFVNNNIRFIEIINYGAQLMLENSQFYRNKALYNGGAIYSQSTFPLIISNVTFDSCSSEYFGGAVMAYQLQIINCTFINQKSKIGGAVFTSSKDYSKITNTIFINNKATICSQDVFQCQWFNYDKQHSTCDLFQIDSIFEYNQQLQQTPLYIKPNNYTKSIIPPEDIDYFQSTLMYGILYIIKFKINNFIANITTFSLDQQIGNLYSYLHPVDKQNFFPLNIPNITYPYLVTTYSNNLDCSSRSLVDFVMLDYFYNQQQNYIKGCFNVSQQCGIGMSQTNTIYMQQIYKQCTYCNTGQFSYELEYNCQSCNSFYYSQCYASTTFLNNGFWRSEFSSDESSLYQCSLSPQNCFSSRREGIGNSLCKEGYLGDQCLTCDINGIVWGDFYGHIWNIQNPQNIMDKQPIDINLIIKLDQNEKLKGNLYLGSVYGADSIKQNNKEKIFSILSIGNEPENQIKLDTKEFNHLTLEIYDHPNFQILHFFEAAISFIKQALSKNNVLVHCFAGASRSSTIIIAYLMKEHQMTFQEAFNLTKSKRQKTNPNQGFLEQLKQYENIIKQQIQ